jgi:hypothetical protein
MTAKHAQSSHRSRRLSPAVAGTSPVGVVEFTAALCRKPFASQHPQLAKASSGASTGMEFSQEFAGLTACRTLAAAAGC